MFSRQLLKEMKALKAELENTRRTDTGAAGSRILTPNRPTQQSSPQAGAPARPPFAHIHSDMSHTSERPSSAQAQSRLEGVPSNSRTPSLFSEGMARSASTASVSNAIDALPQSAVPHPKPLPAPQSNANAWGSSPPGTPHLSQSMHSTLPAPDPFVGPATGAQSMFLDRPSSAAFVAGSAAGARPNPFGTLNSGSSGTARGRSRISASEAARSLAGRF